MVKSIYTNNQKYDYLYVTDTLKTFNWLYEVLLKKNQKLQVIFYEEGPVSVLCDQGNHFKNCSEYGGRKFKIINKVLGIKYINGSFSGGYTSVKSFLNETYFPWFDIPIIKNKELQEYIEILNQFWNYKNTEEFHNKIIYLEESFFTDGRENRDEEVIKDLIHIYGKEKLIVKLHPRTRINRFNCLGIKTYTNTAVPWELIALNNGFKNSILICYASGAVIHPTLYWGITQKSICLVRCKEYHFDYLDSAYYKMYAKVCSEKKIAFLPNSKEEFINYLSKYKG